MSVSVMNFVMAMSLSAAAFPQGPPPPALPQTPLQQEKLLQLVADLNSDDFSVRRSATRSLKQSGREAIPQLARAAAQGNLEVTTRTIDILESLYTSRQERTSTDSELALEQLAVSENRSAAHRAEAVLNMYYYEIREPRLIAKIEKLGGVVKFNNSFLVDDPRNPGKMRKPLDNITLARQWTGGDAGAKYLKQLQGFRTLYIARSKDISPISLKAEEELRQSLPKVSIQRRGLALLGILGSPDPQGRGVYVSRVSPGSGAAQAGLRSQDLILRFQESKVPTFDLLIELIKETNPGQKVKLVIERKTSQEPEQINLGVVMGEFGK